jgi:vacuolar-type H+-ATPase subunit H
MREKSQANLSIDGLMAGNREAFATAIKWQQEFLSFFGRRMASYVELSGQLPQCRNPGDWLGLQTRFLQQLLSDYRAEAEWVTRQFSQAERPVQKQIDQAFNSYEETLLKAQRDAAKIIDMAKDQAQRIVENAQVQPVRKTAETASKRARKTASH